MNTMDSRHMRLWFLEQACESRFALRFLVRKALYHSTFNRRHHGLPLPKLVDVLFELSEEGLIQFSSSNRYSGGEMKEVEKPKNDFALAKLLKRSMTEHLFYHLTELGAREFEKESQPNWDRFIRFSLLNHNTVNDELHIALEARSEVPLQTLHQGTRRFSWHSDIDFFSSSSVKNWQALYWKRFRSGVRVEIVASDSVVDDMAEVINFHWRQTGFNHFQCVNVLPQ